MIDVPAPIRNTRPVLDARITDAGAVAVCVGGDWRVHLHPPDITQALDLLGLPQARSLEFAARDLGHWDTSLVAALTSLTRRAASRKLPVHRNASLPQGVCNLIDLALTVPPRATARTRSTPGLLEWIGDTVHSLPGKSLDVIGFIGEIAVSFSRLLRGRAICGAKEVWVCVQEAGAGALPIVALTSLLVGLILAFVGVVQLRLFGAEIYVASLVTIGMTRIMGAVMTGVVLAGRTGASYAAIIGSMQTDEEVDALVSLGVPPVDYLILPRIIALATMTPLLVLYADFMGILGGFIVGSLVLSVDPLEYLTYTRQSLKYAHLFVGMTHGFAFGLVVAVAGCYQGLRCNRSTEGVGAATTAAVVNAIVFMVLVTAVLTMLFNAVRI